MSKIKRHITVFVVLISIATSFTVVNEWRGGKMKSVTLPLIDAEPVKPKQEQHSTGSITKREVKNLQQKLDKALVDIARLQREKLALIEKLDEYSRINSDAGQVEDIFNTQKDPILDSIEPNQTAEQLETRFNQENQDTDWSKTVEESIINKYNDTLVDGNDLVEARCHSTLCRVEMSHLDQEAQSFFWANVSAIEGLSTEQIYIQSVDNQEEGLKTVIFVSRDGYKIDTEEES